jgi:hypothetical protein
MFDYHKIIDHAQQWWRYPQPSRLKQATGFYTDVVDTEYTARRLASEESARYIVKHLRTTPNFATDYDLHHWVATTQLNTDLLNGGMVAEFGVATGRTINHFARWLPQHTIHGFDSFAGLPENWTSRMPKGFFSRNSAPSVRNNVILHTGWFNDTLPPFVEQHRKPLALLHIDCDLYSSTVTILNNLVDRIVPGTIIVFDEYFNYPGWQQDEFRAWQEHTIRSGCQYEYIGYVSRHQQVAIRILG